MRSTGVSDSRVFRQTLDERRSAAGVLGDYQNRVVAGNRSNRLGQPGTIDGERERLGLPGTGADDDQLLHSVDTPEKLGRGAFKGGQGRLRTDGVGTKALIGTVSSALHETKLLDVSRDGRLRRFEASFEQTPAQLLLTMERFALDQLEDGALAA